MAQEIVFVDANIFLEIALKNEKSEACKKFLHKILSGEIDACTSDFIVYSCLLQIHYKSKDMKQMENFLLFLSTLNLEIIRPSYRDLSRALEYMKKFSLDLDDALVVACITSHGIKILVSLDTDFDKVSIVQRRVPE